MTQITEQTIYVVENASGGKLRFDTRNQAEKACKKIDLVKDIVKQLPKRPNTSTFANSQNSFVQWTAAQVTLVDSFLSKHGGLRTAYEDSTLDPLPQRFYCLDSHKRERGQPYFALNHDTEVL